MICLNNLRMYSLIACFVVLDAVSQSQDLSSLLLEYPHFVAKHLSGMTANLSLLLFPEKKNIIFVLSFDMKICSLTNGLNSSDWKTHWNFTVYFQPRFQLNEDVLFIKKTSPYVACMSQSLGFILKTNFRIFLAFCFSDI